MPRLCDCGRQLKSFVHNCPNSSNMPEIVGCPVCDDSCPECITGDNADHAGDRSYFPILLLYTESGEEVVCQNLEDIISGKSFKVLKTNYSV